jgi:hypothetical protein
VDHSCTLQARKVVGRMGQLVAEHLRIALALA